MTTELGLFSPTTIGAINVSNRIAMAPLTRARAGMDGVPSPLAVEYYGRRASAGLIISEATSVSQNPVRSFPSCAILRITISADSKAAL